MFLNGGLCSGYGYRRALVDPTICMGLAGGLLTINRKAEKTRGLVLPLDQYREPL